MKMLACQGTLLDVLDTDGMLLRMASCVAGCCFVNEGRLAIISSMLVV